MSAAGRCLRAATILARVRSPLVGALPAVASRGLQTAASESDAPKARWLPSWRMMSAAAAGAAAACAFPGTLLPVAEAKAEEAKQPPKSKVPPIAYDIEASGGCEPLKDVPKDVILYQYEVCPFCNKVKAILDFYDIPYKAVEVNPLMKGELKWSEYKKVPTCLIDGQQVNDSSAIMSAVHKVMLDRKGAGSWFSFAKHSAADLAEEEKWRRWVDERLVHVLTVNIYQSHREAFQAFHYITEEGNFGLAERKVAYYAGALAMFIVAKGIKKKHAISDKPRDDMFKCADEWAAALGHRAFLGGGEPNLADVSVFGVLRAIRNMDAFRDTMAHSPDVERWYGRMEALVGDSCRVVGS